MSNKSSEIFDKNWTKMSKLITSISDAIKSHYKTSNGASMPDHEVLLLSLQLFSLICGKKWGFSQEKLNELWLTSKDLHKLVQATTVDVKSEGGMQKPSTTSPPKQYKN